MCIMSCYIMYQCTPVLSVLDCVGKPLVWVTMVTTGGFFILCGGDRGATVYVCARARMCVCKCVCAAVRITK